jgi:hypothetical protein
MNLNHAITEVAVQYVGHNILQADYKNADDHKFLKSTAQRSDLCLADREMVLANRYTCKVIEVNQK